jgi:hypothetical protein
LEEYMPQWRSSPWGKKSRRPTPTYAVSRSIGDRTRHEKHFKNKTDALKYVRELIGAEYFVSVVIHRIDFWCNMHASSQNTAGANIARTLGNTRARISRSATLERVCEICSRLGLGDPMELLRPAPSEPKVPSAREIAKMTDTAIENCVKTRVLHGHF